MKILMVGTGHAKYLGRMLEYYGIKVKLIYPIPRVPKRMGNFDITLILGVSFRAILKSKFLPGKKIFYFLGTDAHQLENKTKILLKFSGYPIIYASNELKEIVGLDGEVIPIPVDTKRFKKLIKIPIHKDILYYCPKGAEYIYRPEKLEEYSKKHPKETITIIGGNITNEEMPFIYNFHKKYLRWTIHDANPKMPYEALLCGCEVLYNDEKITEIPDFMLMENTIPKFISYFERLLKPILKETSKDA